MEDSRITRRFVLIAGAAAAAGLVLHRFLPSASVAADEKLSAPYNVTIAEFNSHGQRTGLVTVAAVIKPESEWKKELPSGSFAVTRHADTELPYTGDLLNVHDRGIFRCICCDNALFSSDTKFDSGTGWPSFYQPIAKENVHEISDSSFGMERTAVSCRRCESHLGHVFDDGPQPTGLRYCMNSVSLKFAKLI
jgi:peptide-methionine (R)-S-oxide reductase